MAYVIVTLSVVYLVSIYLLGVTYGDKNIWPSFWTVLTLILPVVNTVVLIYLVTGSGTGFKDFIKELKEARKEE